MKTISPIQSWTKGQSVQATILNAFAINVTLGVSATFYYALLDENLTLVNEGNLTMTGEDYTKWGANDQYAWEFVATSLNLIIIGDYVPPMPESPTEVVAEVTE
jgi:hypothetical protein